MSPGEAAWLPCRSPAGNGDLSRCPHLQRVTGTTSAPRAHRAQQQVSGLCPDLTPVCAEAQGGPRSIVQH